MRRNEYGLGVDIGYRDVVAAVCRRLDDGGRPAGTPGPDGGGRFPADVRMGADGRLALAGPDDPPAERCSAARAMSRIGVPTPLYVAGRPVSAPDVVAAVVTRVREVAEAREGAPPAWTVLTVPPSWGAHRRAVLADALAAASDTPVSLISAAVAVTRSHLATSPLPEHATVVVYDLGASTLDTAVLRSAPGGAIEHLAVPPALPWGGRDVDDAVLGHVSRCLDLPVRGKTPAPDLVVLRSRCVAAKEALSTDMSVDLTVALPTATRSVRLTREDLDELIAESVAASVDAVRSAVDDAGLALDDVDGVLLAGGGGRIPMVAETLSAELGRPLFAASDPALSAAQGAAALALDLGIAGSVGTDGQDSLPTPDVDDTDTSEHTDTSEGTDEDGGHALARRRWSRAGAGAAPAGRPRRPAGPPRSRAAVRTAHRMARGGIVAALFAALLLLPVAVSGLLDSGLVDLTVDRSAADAGAGAPPPPAVPPPGPEQDTAAAAGLSPAAAGQAADEGGDAAAAPAGGSADDEGTAARRRTTATPTTGALPTPEAPVAPGAGEATVPGVPVPPTTVPPTTVPPTTVPPTTVPPTTVPPATPPTTPPTTEAPAETPTTPPVDTPQAPTTPPVEPAPEEDPAASGDEGGATGPAGGVA